jgi:hypothetical protein
MLGLVTILLQLIEAVPVDESAEISIKLGRSHELNWKRYPGRVLIGTASINLLVGASRRQGLGVKWGF